MPGSVRIGTSGFYYEHWRGAFYPEKLPKSRFFEYYAEHFDTVELNATFYHLPKAKTIEHWKSLAPDGFLFALKAYRGITHYTRLKDPKECYRFLHLVKPLKPHLGPILLQLPPSLHKDAQLLVSFLHALPVGYRCAVEFRHKSWYSDEIYELLRRYEVALCLHDFEQKSTPIVTTAKFVYIRFHGSSGRYVGSYDDAALQEWAAKIEKFRSHGLDVYCYFNNDFEAAAVRDAKRLRSLLAAE